MDFFRKAGNFFKGAFGGNNDDEERKRREAEARARTRAAAPKQSQPQPQLKEEPQSKPMTASQFIEKQGSQKPLYTIPDTPKVEPIKAPPPLQDKEFKAFTAEKKVRRFLPDQTKITADRSYVTSKDKFIAEYDKFKDEVKKTYYRQIKDQAQNGDQAAKNALDALVEANRVPRDSALTNAADVASLPGRSIARVATGIPQGLSGLFDWASPGKGTSRVSKALNKAAEFQDESARAAGVDGAYKALNVPTEIASYLIPSVAATKIASKLPGTTKLTTKIADLIADNIDDAGEANKVRRFLGDRVRNNLTLDEVLEESFISGRYIGQNAARGNATTPESIALDVATGIGGGLLFPFKRGRNLDNTSSQADEAVGGTVAAGSKYADNTIRRADGSIDTSKSINNLTDDELRILANDVESPAFDRKKYTDELTRRSQSNEDNIAKQTGTSDTELDKSLRDIVIREQNNYEEYLLENPQLTRAEREAAAQATKARIIQLTDELKANRFGSKQAVEAQAKANDEVIEGQQAVNAEVAANQAAQTDPAPGNVVEATPPVNPEVNINNAYSLDEVNQVLDSNTDRITDTVSETTNPLLRFFNAGRRQTGDRWRNRVDKMRDASNDFIYDKSVASTNSLNAAPSSLARLLFDKFGMKDADRLKVSVYPAVREANASRVKAHAKDIEEMFKNVEDVEGTARRLYQVFEEPDMLARMYGEGTPKISPDDLLPEEKVIFDRLVELNKVRNSINRQITIEKYKAGLMPEEQYFARLADFDSPKSQAGLHSPRIYDIDFQDLGIAVKGGKNSNKGAFMGRQDVAELPQDVIDSMNANPAQSMLFRLQTGMDELGRIDAIKQLEQADYIRNAAPNKNWSQLQGAQYGSANGKFMDNRLVSELENRHIFASDAGQKTSDMLDVYRNSVFGTLDRAVKRGKTAYSPGTFLGNVASNPLFFNRGAGINAVSQAYNMAKNVPALARHTAGSKLDGDILEMQRLGIKIGNTADELVGSKVDYRVIDDNGALKSVKDLALLPNKVYAGADDVAKVTIYKTLKSRGMDSQTAALRVSQFTQDYGNAGRAVEMLADSPILGSPFARFVPELLRLTKNNLVYNPVGTTAGLVGLAALQNKLSEDSGETPEERALRENAPGKVKIPFSSWVNELPIPGMKPGAGDISLDFPVNGAAVNAARALGFNFPMEPGVDPTMSLIKNIAPFTIPLMTDEGGDTQFQPQELVTSMFLKPLWEQAFNKDFMGRTIDDPTNRVRDELQGGDETKYTDNLSDDAKRNNRLYHLAMNWFPGSGEADAVATKTGLRDELTEPGQLDEGKDYYGKERSNLQAIMRALGIKIEDNSPEAREKRVELDEYFNQEKPVVDKFLSENQDLAQAYWDIRSTTRDRYTNVSANDIISPEKYKIIAADTSGRLFNFFKQQAMDEAKKTGRGLDPIYTLPQDQANSVIKLKSMYTGDDVKFQQLLYKEPWFQGYKDADRKYQSDRSEFVKYPGQAETNPRPEEWYALSTELYSDEGVKSKFPLVKQYQDAIAQFEDYDSEERKDFTRNWYDKYGDVYNEEKANYEAARLDIVNKMREIEGAPPMSPEVWSGQFETDEDRAGSFGFGGGGGGSSRPYQTNVLGNLTNFTSGVEGYGAINPGQAPNIAQLFRSLQAGSKGNRKKPPIGASSRGQ